MKKTQRWMLLWPGVVMVAALALAACEKKSDPKVASGGGASPQSVLSVKGAGR